MSAIHRIDDMYALPAAKFFALAQRLPAYQGVVAVRLANQDTPTRHLQVAAPPASELTPEEVEARRNAHRIRAHPKALAQGETPQYVPLEQLLHT
jgi:hypothetical protein